MKYSFLKICIIFNQYFLAFHYFVYNKKNIHSGDSCVIQNCGTTLGEGDSYLYMTKYGCVARIAPFFSTARYIIGPLLLRKSIRLTQFLSLLYEWSHFLTSLFENTHSLFRYSAQKPEIVIFICKLCLLTA